MILEDSRQISECAHDMGQNRPLPLLARLELGDDCLGKVGLCLGQNQANIGPVWRILP